MAPCCINVRDLALFRYTQTQEFLLYAGSKFSEGSHMVDQHKNNVPYQGSTLTVARLAGATDLRWGQVKKFSQWPGQ